MKTIKNVKDDLQAVSQLHGMKIFTKCKIYLFVSRETSGSLTYFPKIFKNLNYKIHKRPGVGSVVFHFKHELLI